MSSLQIIQFILKLNNNLNVIFVFTSKVTVNDGQET